MAKEVETKNVETVDVVNENPKKAAKKTVRIKLPRAARGEQNFQFVGVNGKAYKIMKGEEVEVPVEVAEVLANAEKMRAQADAYIEKTAQ